jgi:hypothetical protein
MHCVPASPPPGLYGLTPLLADLRGILTRYNWIADLLNIIDAPLENFVNANYVPLPQVCATVANGWAGLCG